MMWTLYLDFQVGRQILCTVTGAHLAQCTDHIQSQRALVLVGRSARNGYGWMTSFWLSLSSIMHWTKRTTLGLLPQNRYSICFAHLTWCKILKAACYICYMFSITPCKWSSIVWILFPCLPSLFDCWWLLSSILSVFAHIAHKVVVLYEQGYGPVKGRVGAVEVWGLGGSSADEQQAVYQHRENLFSEQRRKVWQYVLAINWRRSTKARMGLIVFLEAISTSWIAGGIVTVCKSLS